MPSTIKDPDILELENSLNSEKSSATLESLLDSAKINASFSRNEEKDEIIAHVKKVLPPITPRTDFAIRQANHLVERICRDHGVEAPKFTFVKCLPGQEDQISALSSAKHLSVLRLADYLHKRGQIERDYAASVQKLNRQIVQTGDSDERLGQLIVMGEKTAAGHMDWARKIGEERIIEELKALCGENEEQRKNLIGELKKLRGIWSKAVGAFEKVRKNRDKALKEADSAQLALDNASSRGNTSKSTLLRLQEDVQQKSQRAQTIREEYNRAMLALTQRQTEIFKEQIPQCFEGFEKIERSRIAAVRANLINLAQIHLAVADIEIESGQRWLKSLVSLSLDDEIEIFVHSVEERSNGHIILEDEYDIIKEADDERREEMNAEAEVEKAERQVRREREPLKQEPPSESSETVSGIYSCSLTNSESDLLKISNGIDEITDMAVLAERLNKLEDLQTKLKQQYEALQRMDQAYTAQIEQTGQNTNYTTLEAVKTSMRGISQEIEDNSSLIERIGEKTMLLSAKLPGSSNNIILDRINPMSTILDELNRLDQRRSAQQANNNNNRHQPAPASKPVQQQVEKKKSLSRSFDDVLNSIDGEDDISVASPKATVLKLPGTQWTVASIAKSNEELADYFCAEDEEEELLVEERRRFKNHLASIGSIEEIPKEKDTSRNQVQVHQLQAQAQHSPRRKSSISQSTPNSSASTQKLIPRNRNELFRVQALYNFIGRKETDELDLCTGEILSVFDGNGEWWEAENEAGVRGYIPFNYVIRL